MIAAADDDTSDTGKRRRRWPQSHRRRRPARHKRCCVSLAAAETVGRAPVLLSFGRRCDVSAHYAPAHHTRAVVGSAAGAAPTAAAAASAMTSTTATTTSATAAVSTGSVFADADADTGSGDRARRLAMDGKAAELRRLAQADPAALVAVDEARRRPGPAVLPVAVAVVTGARAAGRATTVALGRVRRPQRHRGRSPDARARQRCGAGRGTARRGARAAGFAHGAAGAARGRQSGWSPLHIAASSGSDALVERLVRRLDVGAINARTIGGQTPLHYAASRNRLRVRVAPPLSTAAAAGRTAGRWTLTGARSRLSAQCAELLLVHGADADAADRTGETPLHRAAACGHVGAPRRAPCDPDALEPTPARARCSHVPAADRARCTDGCTRCTAAHATVRDAAAATATVAAAAAAAPSSADRSPWAAVRRQLAADEQQTDAYEVLAAADARDA